MVAVAACAALGSVAVNGPPVTRLSLWGDEIASARVIFAGSLTGALDQVRRTEATPPLWYVLAWMTHHLGAAIGGNRSALASVAVLRGWSVFFAALTCALSVVYARRFLTLTGATAVAALTAFGDEFLNHGSELRAYSLLTLLSIAFALALEAACIRPNRRHLVPLAAIAAAGVLTHYFFLLLALSALAWLLAWGPRGSRARIAVAVLAGMTSLLAWAPSFAHQVATKPHHSLGAFRLAVSISVYSKLFVGSQVWDRIGSLGLPIHSTGPGRALIAITVVAGAGLLMRERRSRLCGVLIVFPVVGASVIWAVGPRIFAPRNLLVVAPFGAIGMVRSVEALRPRAVARVASVGLVAAMLICAAVHSQLGRTPYDRIGDQLLALGWTPNAPVLLFGHYWQKVPLGWYLPDHPVLQNSALRVGTSWLRIGECRSPEPENRRFPRSGSA